MTDPVPRDDTRAASDGPAMADHPELESDDVRQDRGPRKRGPLSRMMSAGILALVIVVILLLVWIF